MSDLPKHEGHGRRGKLNGAEWDVFTRWRKLLCYTQRPGVTKNIKSQFNRKARAREKRQLRRSRDER